MSKNKTTMRMFKYGERTAAVNILVPESKKAEITVKFYKILDEYIDPKMLEVEKKAVLLPNPRIYDMKDEVPNLPKKVLKEFFKEAITRFREVAALPKDRKRIEPGLYSGDGKFYTNKIVENNLQILEWTEEEEARTYLSNLRK